MGGGDDGGGHWLVRLEWCPVGWLVCLHLLMFPCTMKSRSSVLALAHPGGPGKRAIKWMCVCLCVTAESALNGFLQEAQLPQRDHMTPRTHFTRDRRTDRRKDGQKAIARTRYAVCVARKKRAETEDTNGKDSWQMVIYCMRSPILVPRGPPNAGVLYNGRSQQTIRIQKRYFDRVHKPSHIIRTI